MTDEELMIKYAINDDSEAFDELYRRYSDRVYSYLKKRCFNLKDAEETYQNVFLKIHHNRKSYDLKYPFSAWLFTIVKNVMTDDFRKIKTRSKPVEQVENTEITEMPDFNLPDDQKKLLELRYLEGWSFEEIAKDLKINATTVRKRISRLIQQLRSTR